MEGTGGREKDSKTLKGGKRKNVGRDGDRNRDRKKYSGSCIVPDLV